MASRGLSSAESTAASTAQRLAVPTEEAARKGSMSGAQRLITGLPMDFATDYEREIGFAVQERSVCVCDSNPHAIYSGKDAEKHKDEQEAPVGQFFDLGVAEAGQTCRAVCENRFDEDGGSVKSARQILEETLEEEAKQMGYSDASNPEFQEVSNNTQYEDICECDLEFNAKKNVLELKNTESFKANQRPTDDYELRTREHWLSQDAERLDKDVIYATIPKGDKKTTCATQCKRVANINKDRAVRDHTAEFVGIGKDGLAEATPLGILATGKRDGDGQFASLDGEAADIFSLAAVWAKI